MWRSHTSLPPDLWRHIATKLDALSRIRFRSVCKSWASLLPHTPCLMLLDPKTELCIQQDQIQQQDEPIPPPPPPPLYFVSLGEPQIHQLPLPDLHRARCVGSKGNWLITSRKYAQSIRLVNPFSKQQIFLPPQWSFECNHIWKVVVSASPSDGGDCFAMAIAHNPVILAMARLGGEGWIGFELDQDLIGKARGVHDVIFYKGLFYAVSFSGRLLVCDIGDGASPTRAVYISSPVWAESYGFCRVNYLAEWLGELLLVIKLNNGITFRTMRFKVYKFDFVGRKWDELQSLGEYSLFLGVNASACLRASDYFGLVKKNCIYFTDRMVGVRDMAMGMYDLEDNYTIPQLSGVQSDFLYTPPVWIVPT